MVQGSQNNASLHNRPIRDKWKISRYPVQGPKRRHNAAFNHHNVSIIQNHPTYTSPNTAKMSFLGMGRPQPTSEQKIAAVESEMRMMADTYNR